MEVKNCLWSELDISNDLVKVAAKILNAKFIASEL